MKTREGFPTNPLDEPNYTNQNIQTGIHGLLGNSVAFHHTLRALGSVYAYGGLFENRAEAEAEQKRRIEFHQRHIDAGVSYPGRSPAFIESCKEGVEIEKNAEIIELQPGDLYLTEGVAGFPQNGYDQAYMHGKDDGTHGSEKED